MLSLTGMTLEDRRHNDPFLLWKHRITDTREEDEIIEKSQIHSLSRGDKLLRGGSLREVKKYGVNAQVLTQVKPDT